MLNLGIGFNSTPNYNPAISGRQGIPVLGRVYDIVLDENHSDFKKIKTIGAIRYNVFDDDNFNEEPENLFIAYPLDSTSRTYPLKNEIVVLTSGPKESADREDSELKVYYSTVISIWNASNHNAAPSNDSTVTDIGNNAKELDSINTLYPNHGDHIINGRFGNSIRLGGYKGSNNTYTDDTNEGKPYTLISNGRPFTGNILNPTSENIDNDDSSIYIMSDHIVPLTQSRTKLDSNVDKTIIADRYKGAQILLNSDRIVLNAKKEDILMSSRESLTITSKDIGIDAEEYISLDAKKIYLGVGSKNKDTQLGSAEPVILGHRLEDFLQILVDELKKLSSKLRSAKTVDFKAIPGLNGYGISLKFTADILQTYINPNGASSIKSKKTFTE